MNAAQTIMRALMVGVAIASGFLPTQVVADQAAIPRIGVLTPPIANSPLERGLRESLRELRYMEGKNIMIEWRRSAGTADELRSLGTDLAGLKVDIILAFGTSAARAALEATTVIPVVFVSGDPVASGLAASMAHPGGNGTGVSVLSTELTARRLELLRLFAPQPRRIAYLMNSSNVQGKRSLDEAERAARTLGVQLVKFDARNAGELNSALHAIRRSTADGVVVSGEVFFMAHRPEIAAAVRKARLPAIFPYREYHDDSVLMSYGLSQMETMRLLAGYVDKILKGVKPADLPIEQISKYELVIDLRVARELGLNVPPELLLRADEVIR